MYNLYSRLFTMDIMNNAYFANYCITVLSNRKKLPSYAYYEPGDDVQTMFWNELSSNELMMIIRHLKRHQRTYYHLKHLQ